MDRETLAGGTARIAAELRNQLTQMAAASQVLERSASGERDRAYLAVLNQGICRMLRIVGRMELAHRLTDEERIRCFPKDLDLSSWLEELGQRLESVLANIQVTFSLSCPPRLMVQADADLLQQMLLELIANAALAGTQVSLTVTQSEGKVCFTVSDNGPGVPSDRLSELFTTPEPGAHYGIALAQQIAELHGGRLMADPAPGRGLTMVAAIPLQESGYSGKLESPRAPWHSGGFDDVLVAMSNLLPSRAFLPEDLG